MKNILVILMTLFLPLYSQSIKAGYDVSFGVIGEIGKAEITYIHNKDDYTIIVEAWSTGMTSVLSQNRKEIYASQGKIVDGILRPEVFVKYKTTDRYTKSSLFIFNHQSQKIHIYRDKEISVSSTSFDVNTMKNIKVDTDEFDHSQENFRFYTDNDLLSLFFNTQKILSTLKDGESKELSAIGSKTPNCVIDIEVPTLKKRHELQEAMSSNKGRLLTIILHQEIFQSEKGELHVIFDEDGFAENVLLKDVILFGDIRGKRVYQKLSSK